MRDEAIRFAPVRFSDIEGWEEDDHAAALAALVRSGRGADVGGNARAYFEANYLPHAIESGEPGLVTGYYEPEVKGSRVCGGRFNNPVYALPPDLVKLVPDLVRARFDDRLTAMRETSDGQVPYYTRDEIEGGALGGRGLELLYLDDPVELFFMQVQGSGLVHLDDGSSVRLSFAGKNGHPYTSIGKLLVDRAMLPANAASMDAVKAWLRADAERGRALMRENRSYVFFRELSPAEGRHGPLGAAGVPLSPRRSLAVDAALVPLGCPVFVAAEGLADEAGKPFRRLMIAQDVGSAIRGPARGDIYWGTGEAAGAIAGTTKAAARFFVLLPKN